MIPAKATQMQIKRFLNRFLHVFKVQLLGGLLFCPAAPGGQFYVDSLAGDDNNAGNSPNQPWRSLEKVNAAVLAPGDHMLLHAGSAWSSPLVITAQGTADRPVVFESYGNGARPRLNAAGKFEDAVVISNAQHVVLRHLDVSNTGAVGSGSNTPPRRGVH